MKVRVLFFGATVELVGSRQVEMPIGDGASAADILEQLTVTYPNLENHRLLFAVNEEYVAGTTPLKAGDELAVFTPVSGG